MRGEIVGQLDDLLGRDGAQAVQALLEGARRDTGNVLATVFGAITFALAATGAFLELQTALNTIWRVKPKENANVASFLWDRVRSFALVVAIGFLLLLGAVFNPSQAGDYDAVVALVPCRRVRPAFAQARYEGLPV